MHALLPSAPLTLQQATTDPCLHHRLLVTHGQVCVSLLWGPCSFLLGPGVHKVLFVPFRTLFPQFFVSSGGSMVGLMATSSMRAYATPRSASRAPALQQATADPYLHRRHSKVGLAQSLWVLLVWTSFCLSPPSLSGWYGVSF